MSKTIFDTTTMNSRDYKPNYSNSFFHAYNRGVRKEPIFLDDQDYQNFLFRVRVLLGVVPPPKRTTQGGIRLKPLSKNSLEVLGYCLMPNHFHFLIKQNEVNSMKAFFHRLCTSYAKYFNKKYSKVGHVFQDIFKCKNIVEDEYIAQLTGYIHLNPKEPFSWQYSSLKEYLGQRQKDFSNYETVFTICNISQGTYADFLHKKYNIHILGSADLVP